MKPPSSLRFGVDRWMLRFAPSTRRHPRTLRSGFKGRMPHTSSSSTSMNPSAKPAATDHAGHAPSRPDILVSDLTEAVRPGLTISLPSTPSLDGSSQPNVVKLSQADGNPDACNSVFHTPGKCLQIVTTECRMVHIAEIGLAQDPPVRILDKSYRNSSDTRVGYLLQINK